MGHLVKEINEGDVEDLKKKNALEFILNIYKGSGENGDEVKEEDDEKENTMDKEEGESSMEEGNLEQDGESMEGDSDQDSEEEGIMEEGGDVEKEEGIIEEEDVLEGSIMQKVFEGGFIGMLKRGDIKEEDAAKEKRDMKEISAVLCEIGVKKASSTQVKCLADLPLTDTYECFRLFLHWVNEGFYDFNVLPRAVKQHLMHEDKVAIENLYKKWDRSTDAELLKELTELIEALKHSEQDIIQQVNKTANVSQTY